MLGRLKLNKIRKELFMVMEIKLTTGETAIVEDRDYSYLMQWKWFRRVKNNQIYAIRHAFKDERLSGQPHLIKMHRVIMCAEKGMIVDHINHNGLDNTRNNLRVVTNQENLKNMKLKKNNTSGFTGVTWCKKENRWVSQIMINRKTICIGRFSNKEDAIKARKEANIKYGFHENHGK